MLARHVVGGAEPLAERRPAQRPAAPGGVGDAVGQVRVAAGDPLEGERGLGARHVRGEPGLDPARSIPSTRRVGIGACSLIAHRVGASICTTTRETAQPVAGQPADDRLRDRLRGPDRPRGDRRRPIPPAAPGLRERDRPLLPARDPGPQPTAPRAEDSGRGRRDHPRRARPPAGPARRHRQPDPRHGAAGRRRPDRRPDRRGAPLQRPDLLDAPAARGAGRGLGTAGGRRPRAPGSRSAASRRRRRSAPPSTRWPKSCSAAPANATASTG